MVSIDLTERERDILHDVLESTLGELRMEIANTDSKDVREMLQERKAVLRKAADALETSDAANGSAD